MHSHVRTLECTVYILKLYRHTVSTKRFQKSIKPTFVDSSKHSAAIKKVCICNYIYNVSWISILYITLQSTLYIININTTICRRICFIVLMQNMNKAPPKKKLQKSIQSNFTAQSSPGNVETECRGVKNQVVI